VRKEKKLTLNGIKKKRTKGKKLPCGGNQAQIQMAKKLSGIHITARGKKGGGGGVLKQKRLKWRVFTSREKGGLPGKRKGFKRQGEKWSEV